ncbi:hypothetical protein KAX06_05690 [candidate division WOR-3 bacterium]|nr:hypothetical protein [candidate division WOR-3 bacterium]MCK4334257.1 hypothetical protein [candidate division WOR-3 bacterium]
MKRNLLLLVCAALICLLLAGCPNKEEVLIVRQRAERYWNYLYRGETRSAYNMLDKKSQGFLSYPDYARKVGFGPTNLPEVADYWEAYYPNTQIEVKNVSVQRKQAIVSLTLIIPDPTWFPDEAYAEAKRLGLEGHEYALFMIRAQTEALKKGEIPLVRIQENTQLVKEDAEWRVVFKGEE